MQNSTDSNSHPGKEDYFLKTTRLGFRCWTAEDLPMANTIWGDSLVTRFVGGPFSAEQVQARLTREIACMKDYGVQYWPIFLLANGEHVGCAGMRARKPEERIFSMGFYLRPQYWGMGFAVESSAAVISYAFGTLGIRELYAAHHPENFSSGKVLAKLGFTFTHRELYPPTGLMHAAYSLKPPAK
ncbi:MAG TPA: GNAT family N-acetyltransferase [Candidatus Acidoferrum sp.]|nr:GNAT family N-acetyltransferase [Candidatus Acidoferrum sp.]